MIVHINSYPGVGKLTIASELAELIGGKLLDNHSIYNVAFALTEFRTSAFYDTVRAFREIAYNRVLDLPPATPVILTNWCSQDSAWGNENWDAAITLARRRGCVLYIVILTCSPEENVRRIQGKERAAQRKPRDPEMVNANRDGRPLLDRGGDRLLRLDVTELSADVAALEIASWLAEGPRDHERRQGQE